MKNALVTLSVFALLTSNAQSNCLVVCTKVKVSAGKNSFIKKPLGTGKRSVDQAARNAGKSAFKATGTVAGIATSGIDGVVHAGSQVVSDTGKTLGDGVKEIRDDIAQMQGVNVDKILKKIRRQIKFCEKDKKSISKATQDLISLRKYIEQRNKSKKRPSSKKLNSLVIDKLNNLETFKVNNGKILSLATSVSSYVYSSSLMNTTAGSWAYSGGFYTAIAAAIVIAMMESVTEEIEHEQKKLTNCGLSYQKHFKEFQKQYTNFIKRLSFEQKISNEYFKINQEYGKILEDYLNLELEMEEELNLKLYQRVSNLELKIKRFLNKYNKQKYPNLLKLLDNLLEIRSKIR